MSETAIDVSDVWFAYRRRPVLTGASWRVGVACQRDGTEICLHDANLPADADVTRTVDALHDAGLSDVLTHVNDGAAVDRDLAEPGEVLIHLDPGPFDSTYYASTVEEQVADQIVTRYTVAGCAGRQDASVQEYDVLRALQHRILQLAGFESLIEGEGPVNAAAQKVFARMGPSEVADVIDEHETEIGSCTLALTDVGA